ncbi:MAG TPA: endonuclease/exonuclease/phosphatase family protein, partial [Flavobacteriales bacterium]|nr:endonuclease/exonuclease/phosphatase family protein [Flavobacteriales bacterium]
ASDADVISFQEVSPQWAEALVNGLSATYPYHIAEPRTNCYGIALFSRLPFMSAQVISLQGTPAVDARINTAQGPVRLLAVHAESPGSYGSFQRRNAQLEQLAGVIGDGEEPTVLLGDLNTVSWDQALRRLCKRSQLVEGQEAGAATWPSAWGLALIPIDHVLVSPGLGVRALQPFHIPGSDHRGLVAQLTRTR